MQTEQEVADLQRRVWEAINQGDVKGLATFLDRDFVLVEADSLVRKGRDDFLEEIRTREGEEAPLAFELVNVRVQLAADMAVAYAQFHWDEELDGERLTMSGNAVDVFVHREDGWKLAGSVYGEVPPFAE